jgi:3-deoxy-D-manno-octulosonate 8-phosphate phosphatase (KDO 8-P phosphatase)
MTSASAYSGPIRLVLFDVDGVLTDGSLLFDSNGEALKKFNVRDGLAIALLRAHGIRSGVLSGKASGPLDHRIRQLGFDVAVTGSLAKSDAFEAIGREEGLENSAIAYVGDDVVDLPLAGRAGRFYAPSDAHPLVLRRADHILVARGGHGAGREVAEHVLASGGLSLEQAYEPLMREWEYFRAVQ